MLLALHNDEAFSLYLQGILAMMKLKREPRCFLVQVAREAVIPMQEALNKFRELNSTFYEADALTWLGAGELSLGQIDEGLAHQHQGLVIRRALGDRHGMAWVLLGLGHMCYNLCQYQEAESYIRQASGILREYRSIKGIVISLITLALITLGRGNLAETREIAQEILECAQSANNLEGILSASGILSILASVEREDYQSGMELARRSQETQGRSFVGHIDPHVHAGLSFAACGLGDFVMMRHNASYLFRGSYTEPSSGSTALVLEAAARCHEGDLTSAIELLALTEQLADYGRGWMAHWAYLTRLRADLKSRLAPDLYAEAWERGMRLDVETTIRGIVEAQSFDAQSQANRALLDPLTERELEVLRLVAAGMSNREIADRLVLTVGTVKVHTQHIYQKLGVSSRTQAIAKAADIDLI